MYKKYDGMGELWKNICHLIRFFFQLRLGVAEENEIQFKVLIAKG